MTKPPTPSPRRATVDDLCTALESIAPARLAQDWDNVGLLAGDLTGEVLRVMLCIDLTAFVVDEAIRQRIQMVVAYHPPLFRPITRLVVPSHDTSAHVHRCIAHSIAIYSPHTAWDAVEGGTNDVLARLCGMTECTPIETDGGDEAGDTKLVTFVPAEHLDKLADALFEAGAGRIGNYQKCSYRQTGTGTFFGTEPTNPAVGQSGRLEKVQETRIEVVVPRRALAAVVNTLRRAHPYEEPAFDLYPLRSPPQTGIGRVGSLAAPTTLAALGRKLKNLCSADDVQMIGRPDQEIERAIVCVGSAGSLPFNLDPCDRDVIVTGEMRHHDALTVGRFGCCAICLGHWTSERPVLQAMADRLAERFAKVEFVISQADGDPFQPV